MWLWRSWKVQVPNNVSVQITHMGDHAILWDKAFCKKRLEHSCHPMLYGTVRHIKLCPKRPTYVFGQRIKGYICELSFCFYLSLLPKVQGKVDYIYEPAKLWPEQYGSMCFGHCQLYITTCDLMHMILLF